MNFNLSIALGAMNLISQGSAQHLSSLGVQQADWSLVTQSAPWTTSERGRVRTTIDAALYGAMEVVAQPRFEVPAEYIAAAITMFVHPVNTMTACRWLEDGRTAADLGTNPEVATPIVSAQQMFAQCMQLWSAEGRAMFQDAFEKRTGLEVAKVEGDLQRVDAKKSKS